MLGALPPVFAGLDPADAQEASSFLQYVGLEAGEVLMEQGDDDLTMAFVTSGAVQLFDGDVRIGNVGSRDMLGEIELFGQMPRVATAVASGPVHLGVLAYEHYLHLCDRGNPAVFNLERHAVRRLAERMRWFDDSILERSQGVAFEIVERSRGFLGRLFGQRVPSVDVTAALALSPLFDWADAGVLQALGQEFTVQRFPAGHVLCRQGQIADRMYLIVAGRVDVVLVSGPGTAEMIATLGEGQACGEASLSQHTPRSATYVCRDDVVALELTRVNYDVLFSLDDALGSTFRQGVLRNMIALLLATQRRFAEIEHHRSHRDEDYLRGTPVNAVWRD